MSSKTCDYPYCDAACSERYCEKHNDFETVKLNRVKETSQKIGEFMEWLTSTKGIELAKYGDNDRLSPFHFDINSLLAEYFKIDLRKMEREQQELIATIQSQ